MDYKIYCRLYKSYIMELLYVFRSSNNGRKCIKYLKNIGLWIRYF